MTTTPTESRLFDEPGATPGPLVVSSVNPRYFTVAGGDAAGQRAIYLTGSHLNNNFHDGMGAGASCSGTPEQFNFSAYIDLLRERGHNFIRLWRWEQFRSQVGAGSAHFCATPQPWLRSGPGMATDGGPKFDLAAFDPAYFERLRERVLTASNAGIYVSVMLFEGFGLHLTPPPDNVAGHPFHAANNVNQIGIASIVDYQVLPLDPRVQALQEAYIQQVIHTVHDLPNVLYEVANESAGASGESVVLPDGSSIATPIGDSTGWQYWVIDFVKQYEQRMGYDRHPVGMTFLYPVPEQRTANDSLFNSPADWVSPGFDDSPLPGEGRWRTDPPPADGRKVVLSDTDHYAPFGTDALWAWKTFLRGHHPLLYDFGLLELVRPSALIPGLPAAAAYEAARHAMGDTLRFARRISLLTMTPRGELSSTGYVLANPGEEYLVLQPGDTADPFSVTVAAGVYAAEWFGLNRRETVRADTVALESSATVHFSPPPDAAGPAVLYLKKVAG